MKTKSKKSFPMNGPSLEMQRLMERPRQNRKVLKNYFKDSKITRPETVEVCNLV